MPIKALNTFSWDWIIQARVARKSEKRSTKSGGSVLKIEIIDAFGTVIECTFFNDAADRYEKRLIENGVYLFSGGYVKLANRKYSIV